MKLGLLVFAALAACAQASGFWECQAMNKMDPVAITSSSNNEDPTIVRHPSNGNFYLVFFTEAFGGHELMLTSSPDGVTWSPSTRLTYTVEQENAPSLGIDSSGRFHLVYFIVNITRTDVIYQHSDDLGVTWSPILHITDDYNWDWVPNLRVDSNDVVHILWTGTTSAHYEIWHTWSTDHGVSFNTPVQVTNVVTTPGANALVDAHDFGTMYQSYDGTYYITYNRYKNSTAPGQGLDFEIYQLSSTDGISFPFNTPAPRQLTNGIFTSQFPVMFEVPDVLAPGGYQKCITWTCNYWDPFGDIVSAPMDTICPPVDQFGQKTNICPLSRLTDANFTPEYWGRPAPAWSPQNPTRVIIAYAFDANHAGVRNIYTRLIDFATVGSSGALMTNPTAMLAALLLALLMIIRRI